MTAWSCRRISWPPSTRTSGSERWRRPSLSPAQTPLVDVRSVSKGTVVSQETLAVLPTSKSVGRIAGARSRRSVTGQRCRHRRDQRRTVGSHLCLRRPTRRHASDDERHALQQPERRWRRPAVLRQSRFPCRRTSSTSVLPVRRSINSPERSSTRFPGKAATSGLGHDVRRLGESLVAVEQSQRRAQGHKG